MWAYLLRILGIASIGFLVTGYHSDNYGWVVHVFIISFWLFSDFIELRKRMRARK